MSKHPTSQRLADFLPYQLSIASNAVSSRIAEQYRRRFALKTTEWRIMAVLGDSGALTPREIGRATLMDKVAVSRACRTLEGRELAAREPHSSDGRSHVLGLTATGREVFEEIMEHALEIEERLFDVLEPDERETFAGLLDRVYDRARED